MRVCCSNRSRCIGRLCCAEPDTCSVAAAAAAEPLLQPMPRRTGLKPASKRSKWCQSLCWTFTPAPSTIQQQQQAGPAGATAAKAVPGSPHRTCLWACIRPHADVASSSRHRTASLCRSIQGLQVLRVCMSRGPPQGRRRNKLEFWTFWRQQGWSRGHCRAGRNRGEAADGTSPKTFR